MILIIEHQAILSRCALLEEIHQLCRLLRPHQRARRALHPGRPTRLCSPPGKPRRRGVTIPVLERLQHGERLQVIGDPGKRAEMHSYPALQSFEGWAGETT